MGKLRVASHLLSLASAVTMIGFAQGLGTAALPICYKRSEWMRGTATMPDFSC